jgi:putative nucleotidyltransferase with HDIG domain
LRNEPSPLHPSLFEQLRRDPEIITLIEKADAVLAAMGYTDHGRRHVTLVAVNAGRLLSSLGYDRRECDLAASAALLHDIGNCAGRESHAAVGAAMAYQILTERGVPPADAADVMTAIGNHDEIEGGMPVSPASAALIIADKADIHRSRVRTRNPENFDIHDRVNYAVTKADLRVVRPQRRIILALEVDRQVATPEELADLFAVRFGMSEAAARFLGCRFDLEMNGHTQPDRP